MSKKGPPILVKLPSDKLDSFVKVDISEEEILAAEKDRIAKEKETPHLKIEKITDVGSIDALIKNSTSKQDKMRSIIQRSINFQAIYTSIDKTFDASDALIDKPASHKE